MPLTALVRHHALEVIQRGYTVIKRSVSEEQCRQAIASFRQLEARNPDIFSRHRGAHGHYPRIVNLHAVLSPLRALFTRNSTLLQVQDALFGAPASLYTTLFYEVGSQQSIHRDTPLFCTKPEYLYFGNSVYLEAADDQNGCLEVIEGGHLLPELDRRGMARKRYGLQGTIPPIDDAMWSEYQNTLQEQARAAGLKVTKVHVDVGDSLIWHPQLPHGGSPIADQSRTRFSLVMHTTPVTVPVYHQHAFFNPENALPEVAPWGYEEENGRSIVKHDQTDFGHGAPYPAAAFHQA
jgi:phytanoyl-CoA hydroxylase